MRDIDPSWFVVTDDEDVLNEAQPSREGEEFPVKEWMDGFALPDIAAIDRSRWVAALRPLPDWYRRRVVQMLPLRDQTLLLIRMGADDFALSQHGPARPHKPAIVPRPGVPAGRSLSKQVNFRLDLADHERLTTAASALGMKPTQLARALVISGVNRTLSEHAT